MTQKRLFMIAFSLMFIKCSHWFILSKWWNVLSLWTSLPLYNSFMVICFRFIIFSSSPPPCSSFGYELHIYMLAYCYTCASHCGTLAVAWHLKVGQGLGFPHWLKIDWLYVHIFFLFFDYCVIGKYMTSNSWCIALPKLCYIGLELL